MLFEGDEFGETVGRGSDRSTKNPNSAHAEEIHMAVQLTLEELSVLRQAEHIRQRMANAQLKSKFGQEQFCKLFYEHGLSYEFAQQLLGINVAMSVPGVIWARQARKNRFMIETLVAIMNLATRTLTPVAIIKSNLQHFAPLPTEVQHELRLGVIKKFLIIVRIVLAAEIAKECGRPHVEVRRVFPEFRALPLP